MLSTLDSISSGAGVRSGRAGFRPADVLHGEPGNGRNDALSVYLLAVLADAQIQRVKAFLLVDHLGEAGLNGLDQNALAVPIRFLI